MFGNNDLYLYYKIENNMENFNYDDFMMRYYHNHKYCPKCGENGGFIVTLAYCMLDINNKENYKDLNRSTCISCGDVHVVHDRIDEETKNNKLNKKLEMEKIKNLLNRDFIASDYEMKKMKRFSVVFPENLELFSWMVRSCEKPKYFDGKWLPMMITLYDPVGPSSSEGLYQQLITNNKGGKIRKKNKPFIIKLFQKDPTDLVVEEWEVEVKKYSIDFGNLDYSSIEPQEVTLIIEPKNCVLKK